MDEEMLQFQVYKNQLSQITQYLQQIQSQKENILAGIDALSELSKSKDKSGILAQITPGIYIEADIKDNQNVIINCGANTAVKK